ncbi:MAG: hypothetical protein LBC03_01330 [Nitrososphaerota archaeon]|jgi:hypothetical protein|nr:hypothetical protein [Nitrososphaerota archaeon]
MAGWAQNFRQKTASKTVTLTSDDAGGFFKLIGANSADTIIVNNNGVLKLDGIHVTHLSDAIPVAE